MKKLLSLFAVAISVAMCCAVIAGCTKKPGAPKDYVEIGSAAAFDTAMMKVESNTDGYATKTFKLTADIDVSGSGILPISGFKGVFDGQFHKLEGLNLIADAANTGLFETLDGATVRNLEIVDAALSNSAVTATMGVLAATAKNANIEYVTVSGTADVAGNAAVVGGLLGSAESTSVLNVRSNINLKGKGKTVGGVVGKLNDGSTVVNAYCTGATSESTAASLGSIVGEKTLDSAVAYSFTKSGKIVGTLPAREDYQIDSVVGCKIGADFAGLGWSSEDWNMDGTEPVINTKLDKLHAAPAVTVDGTAVSVAYGEKLPASALPGADANSIASVGLKLGDDFYNYDLPVVRALALTVEKANYSDLVGKWTGSANDAAFELKADGTAVYTPVGGTALPLTRFAIVNHAKALTSGNYAGVNAYYRDAANKEYRVALTPLTNAEKTALGITLANAGMLEISEKSAGAYGAAARFMPAPASTLGAWKSGDTTKIYSAEKISGGYKSLTVGGSFVAVKTCFVLSADGKSHAIDNTVLATENNAPVLKGNGKTYAIASDYYEGVWYAADNTSVTITNGKIGDVRLAAKSTVYGTGFGYTDGGKNYVLVASLDGLARYDLSDGAKKEFVSSNFDGSWMTFVDGEEFEIAISGKSVTIGASDAITGSIEYDADANASVLTVTIDSKEYAWVRGANLVLEDLSVNGLDLYAASAIKAYYGEYTLGTQKFTLGNAQLTSVFGADTDTQSLNITFEDGKIGLTAGAYALSLNENALTLKGYTSPVTGATADVTLFTAAGANAFYASIRGEYVGVSTSMTEPGFTLGFSAQSALTMNGTAKNYELSNSNNGILVSFQNGKDKDGKDIIVKFYKNDIFLKISSVPYVSMCFPVGTEDFVGGYYEFLTGSIAEGAPAPMTIYLGTDASLTIHGTSYGVDEYSRKLVDGKWVVEVTKKEATHTGYVLTFRPDKKMEYKAPEADAVIYSNYDRILPAPYKGIAKYGAMGSASAPSFEVVNGSAGYWETDEDDERVWVPPVYPMYGFRYTLGGKVYTAYDFAYSKAAGVITLSMSAVAADESAINLVVTYAEGYNFDRISIKAGTGDALEFFRDSLIGRFGANGDTYATADGSKTVKFDMGKLLVDGVAVDYTAEWIGETVLKLTEGGVTYTFNTARPEIVKDGSNNIYYNELFAKIAGIKLTSLELMTGTADSVRGEYSMELCAEGLLFNGVPVVWNSFDTTVSSSSGQVSGLRFTTMSDGKEVIWRTQNFLEGYLSFYPNSDYNYRLFVPAAWVEYAGSYATDGAEVNIVSLRMPNYSKDGGFIPSAFAWNGINDENFTFAQVGDTMTFTSKGNTLAITDDGTTKTYAINGTEAGVYTPPSISDFAVTKAKIVGDSNYLWITEKGYYRGTSWSSSTAMKTDYTFARYDGENVVYLGTDYIVMKHENKVYAMKASFLSLIGMDYPTPDGKKASVELVFGNETIEFKVTHDGVLADAGKTVADYVNTDVYANNCYIEYQINGKQYYLLVNNNAATNQTTPCFVTTPDYFNYINSSPISGDNYSKFMIGVVWNGTSSEFVFRVSNFNTVLTYTMKKLSDKAYKFSYVSDDEPTVAVLMLYAGIQNGSANVVAATEAQYALFGEWTEQGLTVETGAKNNTTKAIYVTYQGQRAEAAFTEMYGPNLKFTIGDAVYFASVTDNTLSINSTLAARDRFVGSFTKGTSVTISFESGEYVIKQGSKVATDVVWATDNASLSYLIDDVRYATFYDDRESATSSYRVITLPETSYRYIGIWANNKLKIAVKSGYTSASTFWLVEYNAQSASAISFLGDGDQITFKVGNMVYFAAWDNETSAVKTLVASINTATDLMYIWIGNYTVGGKKLVVIYQVQEPNIVYTVTYGGNPVTATVNADTGALEVKMSETETKYLVRWNESTALEIPMGNYAYLGSYSAGGKSIVFTAEASSKSAIKYTLKVDNVAATSPSFVSDSEGQMYVKFTLSGKTYLLFQKTDKSFVLHELTQGQSDKLSINSSLIGDTKYSLKGVITFNAADGTFTQSITFGTSGAMSTVVAQDLAGGNGFSFTYGDPAAMYYYLIGNGSSKYLVDAKQFAFYGEFVTANGTVNIDWSSASNQYNVLLDDATASVKGTFVAGVDGAKEYLWFTVNSANYVLAKSDANAWVLTKTLKHFTNFISNYSSAKLKLAVDKTSLGAFSGSCEINAEGIPTLLFKFGSTVVTQYEELNGGEVLKVNVNEEIKYWAIGTWQNPTHASYGKDYSMWEVTEAQSKFYGETATVGDFTFEILGYENDPFLVYYNNYANKVTPTFAEVDGIATLSFKVNNVNYTSTVVNNELVVVAA